MQSISKMIFKCFHYNIKYSSKTKVNIVLSLPLPSQMPLLGINQLEYGVQAYVGDIASLVLDHSNKVSIAIK